MSEDGVGKITSDDFAQVPNHVWEYAQDHAALERAARELRRYLEELAARASIRIHAIEARAKSLSSYQTKASLTRDGMPKYDDPRAQINDCVAARVIVFTTSARNDLADLIDLHLAVSERLNPGDKKYNGYDSEHLIVRGFRKDGERDRFGALSRYFEKYAGLEIQIRSVAGHAWAEYEHDVRYKSAAYDVLGPDGKKQIDQWFVEAGGMRKVMDSLFAQIEEMLLSPTATGASSEPASVGASQAEFSDQSDERPLAVGTLNDFITERYSTREVGAESYVSEILAQLSALGIETVGDLETALINLEEGQVAKLMDYPTTPPGARLLDDELLATFTDRYVDHADSDDRRTFLILRLRRVRGKFAIYTVEGAGDPGRALTAAAAVREVAKTIAMQLGPASVEVDGAIASEKSSLLPSAKPRMVRTVNGSLFVATNLTRVRAEEVIGELLARHGDSVGIEVRRAGDRLFA